ncbi:HEAT repeat domain-containing protein [Chloroflexota bacterium]
MSLPVEETIDHLDSDKPLLRSKLVDLSNLSKEEMGIFKQRWATIETERRRQIVYRLVELAEDNAGLNFDSILVSCLKDSDTEVRSKAIDGLWENEDVSLINPLIYMLNKDSSEEVRAAAAAALGKFVMLAELNKLRSSHAEKVSEVLLSVIGDKNEPVEVRRRALEAAAPLSTSQVRELIMEAYQSDDAKFRVSAVYAMGKNCDPSWLPALLRELASPDVEMRYEAATACGDLGEKEVVPCLVELINDTDTDVQLAAIQALGKIGGDVAKESLEQCLDNPSETIRLLAEETLHELEVLEEPFSFRF